MPTKHLASSFSLSLTPQDRKASAEKRSIEYAQAIAWRQFQTQGKLTAKSWLDMISTEPFLLILWSVLETRLCLHGDNFNASTTIAIVNTYFGLWV